MAENQDEKPREVKRVKIVKNKGGRPTVMTETILQKIEEAAGYGMNDKKIIFYAGISNGTYYNYLQKNPKFMERIEALRQKPIMRAEKTVVDNLDNLDNAHWYLERKNKEEYAPPRTGETIVIGNVRMISFHRKGEWQGLPPPEAK